jgi:hypothetical protein
MQYYVKRIDRVTGQIILPQLPHGDVETIVLIRDDSVTPFRDSLFSDLRGALESAPAEAWRGDGYREITGPQARSILGLIYSGCSVCDPNAAADSGNVCQRCAAARGCEQIGTAHQRATA